MFHDCEECNGHGILMAREGWVRCDVCDGSGRAGHKRECLCELCRPPGVSVVENVAPVRYVPRPDARADLDAWMQAGIEAHAYGSAICDESGKPVSVEELNEWAKVKP